jgi:hypothetical protein
LTEVLDAQVGGYLLLGYPLAFIVCFPMLKSSPNIPVITLTGLRCAGSKGPIRKYVRYGKEVREEIFHLAASYLRSLFPLNSTALN